MKSLLFAAVSILLLTSCATPATIRPTLTPVGETERKFERNYEVGAQTTAHVGEPMVRLRDYYVRTVPLASLQADQSFTLKSFPLINWDIPATTPVTQIGTVELEGVTYRVITIEDRRIPDFKFLLTADGAFGERAASHISSHFNLIFKIEPETVRFHPITTTAVATDKGGVNFELVYFGTTGDSFNVAYREFTPDDMARPAFTQNLVYSLQDKTIRFRDLLIEVESATNQSIQFTVIEDGLPK